MLFSARNQTGADCTKTSWLQTHSCVLTVQTEVAQPGQKSAAKSHRKLCGKKVEDRTWTHAVSLIMEKTNAATAAAFSRRLVTTHKRAINHARRSVQRRVVSAVDPTRLSHIISYTSHRPSSLSRCAKFTPPDPTRRDATRCD